MADDQKKPDRVRFVFDKARHHRTFHADGAWAGITPQAEIQLAFFNDLRPMPEVVVHEISPDGMLGEEVAREHYPLNIIREANVTVVLNQEAAQNLIELVQRMLAEITSRSSAKENIEEKPSEESKVS